MGAPAPACAFNLEDIEDRRETTELGQMGRTRIGGEGFTRWFADAMAAMPGHTHERTTRTVKVTVLKAYIQGLATLKSAHLVVRVQSAREGKASDARIYRGADASMNWANTEAEIQEAFDRALTDLTAQIATDLQASCKG
ncbi:hypothetical protein A8M77_17890 [Variovorax sp. JS1663]|nr:hypothetical protein A8M77_17890 [Variovorax sp. JS1663]